MEFRVLGPLEVAEGHRVVDVGGPKQHALLALLLLAGGGSVSADRLIEDVWHGTPPATAEGTLQSYVSRLRKAFGPGRLVSRARVYRLLLAADELDAHRFERLAKEGREALGRGAYRQAAETFADALALWRGPAYAGFADEPYARSEIARLEDLRLGVLEDRIDAELALGRHAEVLGDLEGLVRANPLRERLRGQLMLALYRSARQAEALQAYDDLRHELAEELGIDPGAPLRHLYQAILRQDRTLDLTALAVPVVAPAPRSDRTRYVGREREREALRDRLSEVAAGRGGLVLVAGEQGIGKTRIAEELAIEAAAQGMLPLTGSCYDVTAALPYAPFVEILDGASQALGPEGFRVLLGGRAGEVARIMPELRQRYPDIPPPLEVPPEQERRYLFVTLYGVLEDLSRTRPLMLVLDDLHWADEPTLLLLEHVAQRAAHAALLVLGTYRDQEVSPGTPLARSLEELHRRAHADGMLLRRLSKDGVAAMLRSLSDRDPPAELVKTVSEETEGNPFFVEEVFRHLAEEGVLFDADGQFRASVEIAEVMVPASVRLVIGRRLQRLAPDTRTVLTAAAVAGRSFAVRVLLQALPLQPDAVLDALEEAERAHLVVPTGSLRESRYGFVHELIRQTLLAEYPVTRRQRLHLRTAEALQWVYSTEAEGHAAQLADHYWQAGESADVATTARWLALAGEQALAAAAFEEAERRYGAALSICPANDPGRKASLLAGLGHAQRRLGRIPEAIATWQQALGLFEQAGEVHEYAELAYHVAASMLWTTRFADAADTASAGLTALGEEADGDRVRLLAIRGQALSYVGKFTAAEQTLAEGLALARAVGDPRLEGAVLHAMTQHHYGYLLPREALEAGRLGADLLRGAGDEWELAGLLNYYAWAASYLGDQRTAAEVAAEVEPLAERLGHHEAAQVAFRNRTVWEFATTGDLDLLQRRATADVEAARTQGAGAYAYAWLGLVDFWRGDWDAALGHFEEGVKQERPGFWSGRHLGFLIRHLAYLGGREDALRMLADHRHLLPQAGQANTLGSWVFLLTVAEGLTVLGERQQAAALHPVVVEAMHTGAVWRLFDYRLLRTVAGMTAAAGQLWDEAEAHYREALRLADEIPDRIEQPEVRRLYAQLLAERNEPGDVDVARTLLTEVIDGYLHLGMPRHADIADAARRSLS